MGSCLSFHSCSWHAVKQSYVLFKYTWYLLWVQWRSGHKEHVSWVNKEGAWQIQWGEKGQGEYKKEKSKWKGRKVTVIEHKQEKAGA